jgi:hypothetical protein
MKLTLKYDDDNQLTFNVNKNYQLYENGILVGISVSLEQPGLPLMEYMKSIKDKKAIKSNATSSASSCCGKATSSASSCCVGAEKEPLKDNPSALKCGVGAEKEPLKDNPSALKCGVGVAIYPSKEKSSKSRCGGNLSEGYGSEFNIAFNLFKSLIDKKNPTKGDYIIYNVPSSSFIRTIRWWEFEETLGNNALEVLFLNEQYECYSGVPKSLINDWIAYINMGESAGRFYNKNIRGNFKLLHKDEYDY